MIKGIINFMQVGFGFDVPAREAIRYFESKGLRTSSSYQDMLAEEHQAAFTVAKMMDMDLLKDVQDSINRALKEGLSYQEWSDRIIPTLQANGWWGRQAVRDPLTGKTIVPELGSSRRLQLIYRQNMQGAYSVGQWQQIMRQAVDAPYLMYDAVDDFRTRRTHRAWDNTILPVDHPFWRTHAPPNGWGCRCGIIQLSQDDLDDLGLEVSKVPPSNTQKWTNPRTGQTELIPEGIDGGFAYNAGQARYDELQRLAREKATAIEDRALREAAEEGLGRIASMSDTKLASGGMPLATQEDVVTNWLGENRARKMEEDLFLDNKVTAIAEKYKLTLPEQMAIRHYTETGHGINGSLLGELTLDPLIDKVLDDAADLLRQALKKLPDHQGIVFSRMSLPASFVAKMQVGTTLLLPAFTSADDEADVFAFRKHRLIIDSKTGKKIRWISGHKDTESEVLFTSPTWFKVIKVEQKPDNEIWFFLEEVVDE